jgi:RNA polymerase sigma-70 factor, ECF subfamily
MTADFAQFVGKAVARNDLDLVHATQDGDVSAFEHLVERYDRKLFRIAEHVTHNREDSQDAVQEAFLKAFQHVGDFREDSQFSTWLIRITVNQALMKLRTRRTTKEVSLDEDYVEPPCHRIPSVSDANIVESKRVAVPRTANKSLA